jgi:hypothetical protein
MIHIRIDVIGVAQAPILNVRSSHACLIRDTWSIIGVQEVGESSIEIYSSLAAINSSTVRICPACVVEATGRGISIVIGI